MEGVRSPFSLSPPPSLPLDFISSEVNPSPPCDFPASPMSLSSCVEDEKRCCDSRAGERRRRVGPMYVLECNLIAFSASSTVEYRTNLEREFPEFY